MGDGNGFTFAGYNAHELYVACCNAQDAYNNKENWKNLVRHCMECDFSWDVSAKSYEGLYNETANLWEAPEPQSTRRGCRTNVRQPLFCAFTLKTGNPAQKNRRFLSNSMYLWGKQWNFAAGYDILSCICIPRERGCQRRKDLL